MHYKNNTVAQTFLSIIVLIWSTVKLTILFLLFYLLVMCLFIKFDFVLLLTLFCVKRYVVEVNAQSCCLVLKMFFLFFLEPAGLVSGQTNPVAINLVTVCKWMIAKNFIIFEEIVTFWKLMETTGMFHHPCYFGA